MSLSFVNTRAALLAFALVVSLATPHGLRAQEKPIRIGVLNDQSGSTADVTGQGSVIAARLAIEDFGGKVLGRAIELLDANHQNKPDIAASIARRWIDVDNVSAIVDGGTSPRTAMWILVLSPPREQPRA